MRAALREPQRPLAIALVVLIHAALFQWLESQRHVLPPTSERRSVLEFLPDTRKREPAAHAFVPVVPERLQPSPLPESAPPQLIVPPEREALAQPPIDWQREAQEAAREHALAQSRGNEKTNSSASKPKPDFRWDRSRVQRIEPLEGGGFLVRINERCAIAVSLIAMPVCQIGKKPARGDLFEHMDDAPTPGDWKDE